MAGKASVKYNPDANLRDIVVLQETIEQVAEFGKQLNGSKLKRKAIVLLIQGTIGERKITRQQIEDVLDAAENLGKNYLK